MRRKGKKKWDDSLTTTPTKDSLTSLPEERRKMKEALDKAKEGKEKRQRQPSRTSKPKYKGKRRRSKGLPRPKKKQEQTRRRRKHEPGDHAMTIRSEDSSGEKTRPDWKQKQKPSSSEEEKERKRGKEARQGEEKKAGPEERILDHRAQPALSDQCKETRAKKQTDLQTHEEFGPKDQNKKPQQPSRRMEAAQGEPWKEEED